MHSYNILILCPLWPPATGGSATYYPILVDQLSNLDTINTIHIVTEKVNTSFDRTNMVSKRAKDKLKFHDILPNRIHRARRPNRFVHLLIYLWQNCKYLSLHSIITKHKIDFVVLHSGFFLAPSILRYCVPKKYTSGKRILIAADIRESRAKLHRMQFCDLRFYCSKNIFLNYGITESKTDVLTPVPFDQQDISHIINNISPTNNLRKKFSLPPNKIFISYIGMVREIKNVHKLINAFQIVVKKHPDLHLVLAGQLRDSGNSRIGASIEGSENISFIGPLERTDVIQLIQQSELIVNPSRIEGLTRLCLEALYLKKKVLCPDNIPEFKQSIPDWCINSDNMEDFVGKLEWAISCDKRPEYSFVTHAPNFVAQTFSETLIKNYNLLN